METQQLNFELRYLMFIMSVVTKLPAASASLVPSLTSSTDLSVTSITTALATPTLPPLTGEMAVCTANRSAEPAAGQDSERMCECVSALMCAHILVYVFTT